VHESCTLPLLWENPASLRPSRSLRVPRSTLGPTRARGPEVTSHFSEHRTSGAASEPLFEANGSLLGSQDPGQAACCGCIFVLPSQLKLALGRAGARYKMEPEGLESKFPGTRIGSTVRFYRQCKTWKRLTIQIIVRFGIRRDAALTVMFYQRWVNASLGGDQSVLVGASHSDRYKGHCPAV
jgi:hypothetical protein